MNVMTIVATVTVPHVNAVQTAAAHLVIAQRPVPSVPGVVMRTAVVARVAAVGLVSAQSLVPGVVMRAAVVAVVAAVGRARAQMTITTILTIMITIATTMTLVEHGCLADCDPCNFLFDEAVMLTLLQGKDIAQKLRLKNDTPVAFGKTKFYIRILRQPMCEMPCFIVMFA